MGATTFINYGSGSDVSTVFNQLRDDAAHEHGHGGYTGSIAEKGGYRVLHTPTRILEEAIKWANEKLDSDGDDFWHDKWGDAAAIPVFDPSRQETYGPFNVDAGSDQTDLVSQVTEKMKADKRLKRGDVVTAVWITSYSQQGSSKVNCHANVTITNDPLTRRTVEVKVVVPVGADWNAMDKATREQVKLRSGERVLEVRNSDTEVVYSKPKVRASAPTGKPVTRYVVANSQHTTWDTGFGSQAEARGHAVLCAETYAGQALTNRYFRTHQSVWNFDVSSLTRREDGSPLVTVSCTIETMTITRQVTVISGDVRSLLPNAWLFFGWASE